MQQQGGSSQPPNPAPIMALCTAYWGAQVLLTANRIGLFDALANAPMTSSAAASLLGTAARPTDLLLKSLVGLGLLEHAAEGFRNTVLAQTFLVKRSTAYMGNALRYSDNLYQTWGSLEEALRGSGPAMAAETYLGSNAKITRDFVYGMHDRAIGIGAALAEIVDLGERTTLLDVGGGPGTYSAMLVRKNPKLTSQVIELPGVAAIAREILETMGCADRVSLLPGDYLETPFPSPVDAVLISGVFHRETEDNCRALIRKAFDCLGGQGMLVVSDVFTDANGTGPVFAALFGINMMLTARDGGVHSDTDVAQWMERAGFEDVTATPFPAPMPHRVVTGIKA